MNIVIKLPNKLDERILSFPFLHSLYQNCELRLEEDEVINLHLLASKEHIDVLYLLPFNAYYHEIDPEDLKSIFTIHRGVVELKIEKPEIFISTTESFVDASIGKNLNIPRKAGFAISKNKIFLTDKIERNNELNFSDQLFPLIKVIEPYPKQMINAYARSVKPPYSDWSEGSYTLIDIASPKDKLDPIWKEFFDLAPASKFVLMGSQLSEVEQKDQVNEFIKELPDKHQYKFFLYQSNIEFARVSAHSKDFVTANRALSLLASYVGANNILIGPKNTLESYGPKYFRGECEFIEVKNSSSDQYSKVFDRLLSQN